MKLKMYMLSFKKVKIYSDTFFCFISTVNYKKNIFSKTLLDFEIMSLR